MSWDVWTPSKREPWDLARVAHLHRRAGFAPNWGEIEASLQRGPEATLDHLLATPASVAGYDEFDTLASTIGDAAVGADSADRLRAWWVFRLMKSPAPLQERLALMWHNHFATSNEKVRDVSAMREQNDLFRLYGRGPFTELLPKVIKHRAMLSWLDADANRKQHPNENLARELMELFTLGEGNYSESDVAEAARCLTGWTIGSGAFRFDVGTHDAGVKRVLGETAKMDGDDLLLLLLKQRATSHRIAWRLCQLFLGEELITDQRVSELADGLRKNDLNVGWGVETVLRSQTFFSQENVRAKVASPVEYVIGAIRALEIEKSQPPSTLLLAEELKRLGQDLFYPPNVFGWKEGRGWITTRSIVGRTNFPKALVEGRMHRKPSPLVASQSARDAASMGDFFHRLIINEPGGELNRSRTLALNDKQSIRDYVAQLISSPVNQLV